HGRPPDTAPRQGGRAMTPPNPKHWWRSTVLIGGQWRECAEVAPIENPATGLQIGQSGVGTPSDVNEAACAAHEAGVLWGVSSPEQRASALTQLAERLH